MNRRFGGCYSNNWEASVVQLLLLARDHARASWCLSSPSPCLPPINDHVMPSLPNIIPRVHDSDNHHHHLIFVLTYCNSFQLLTLDDCTSFRLCRIANRPH